MDGLVGSLVGFRGTKRPLPCGLKYAEPDALVQYNCFLPAKHCAVTVLVYSFGEKGSPRLEEGEWVTRMTPFTHLHVTHAMWWRFHFVPL